MVRYVLFLLFCLAAPAVQASQADELCTTLQQKYGVASPACAGAQPIDARLRALPAEAIESHIFFTQGGSRLNPAAKAQLEVLAAVLQTPPMDRACLQLVGHSDTVGDEGANLRLAQRRADTVAEFLRGQLSGANRIEAVFSEGEARPLDGQPGAAAVNRRVEIQARTCPFLQGSIQPGL